MVVLSIVAAVVNHRKRQEENEEEDNIGKMNGDEGKMEPHDDDDHQSVVEEEADIEVQEGYNPDYMEEADEKR